jgi:2,4-dienoyl-CoA reductase-like NADH-dependent reductase (Old Yellow Enzyme family)/thioredoxin reductase
MNLRNKFIFAPVKTGYGNKEGNITDRHLNFYDVRSRYIGAVTPEPLYIDKGLRELPTQIGIASDSHIEGLQNLTATIHRNGAKVIAHLNHPGRMANPKIPGNYFASSTDKPCENGGAVPQRLDTKGMQKVIDLFVNAAKRAVNAGFDIIELQFGHGYLLAQFMSPFVNDRDDEYGGSFKNRIRFPLQVFDAVKSVVNLDIIVRVSGDEMMPDGIKLNETKKLAKILSEKGAAAMHVSAGTVCSTPPWYFQHMFIPKGKTWEFAKAIGDEISTPVIYVGQINTFNDVDKLFNEFNAGYIALGRPLVADENFVGKYLGEVDDLLRPCLSCSDGCLGGVRSGMGLGCLVNPTVGHEPVTIQAANSKKHFAVVGGGLAGMSTAITLKDRGYDVTIFEKEKLGGQFNLAYLPPKKESLKKLVDYYLAEITKKNINIVNKEANAEDLKNNFDAVIIATGSKPALPQIEGLKEFYWAEVLKEENLPENKNVVVVGGGLIGIEVAHKLHHKSNKVFVVEMLGEIARGMEMIEKTLTMKAFKETNVNIFLNTKVTRIDDDKVHIEGEDFKQTLENIDIIVLSAGMVSYNPFGGALDDIEHYVIGDAETVGKAQDAIRTGFDLAVSI